MNAPRLPLALVAIGVLVAAGATAFLLIDREGPNPDAAEPNATNEAWLQGILRDLGATGFTPEQLLNDTDGDSLPDVVENYVFGSDPQRWSTTSEGIPDGWLARYGYDPTVPGTALRAAATPDPAALPDAYGGKWPHAWTLRQAYEWGRAADWDPASNGMWSSGLDPSQVSYETGGIPYAWLFHHGFGPEAGAEVAAMRLAKDDFTVYQNFVHATDPRVADTDQDGLSDSAEVNQYGTDPRRFSTSQTGIPDGWLVAHGLDPTNERIGGAQTRGKGMTVQEVWDYNLARFGKEAAITGQGLTPTTISTKGHVIPDGWLVTHGLDPLAVSPGHILQRASDFPHARNLTTTPPGQAPLADLSLTLADHYTYGRPSTWDEAVAGVWWNSLDPADPDTDGDGIPDAVEIRGWYIQVTTGLGPTAEPQWRHVSSDPTLSDTDGDGLTDGQEYFGRALFDGKGIAFKPTDPSNSDTAFSGLPDGTKIIDLGLWTDADPESVLDLPIPGAEGEVPDQWVQPLLHADKRDSAGSYLSDGEAWDFWTAYALSVDGPYPFTGSLCKNWAWAATLPAIQTGLASMQDLPSLFGPLGDINGDGVPNLVDRDADGDDVPTGMEVRPELYRFSEFSTERARPVTDPANPDTDCDTLPDGWEAKYARVDGGRWTLNPAQADSKNDGITDEKRNLDDDVVEWFSYSPSGQPTLHTFAFTNHWERVRVTDPNIADQNQDGVTEGWLHFWGREYPQLVDAGAAGAQVPDQAALAGLKTKFENLLAPHGEQLKMSGEKGGEISYRRIEKVPEGADGTFLNAENAEKYPKDPSNGKGQNPGFTDILEDGATKNVRMGVIEGTYRHTFARDQEHQLNPYLRDTDGDGLDDEWEAFYGRCPGLDSTKRDADQTPAGDGLTNLFVYTSRFAGFWMDSCLKDTDRDGIQDATEVSIAGMDPTNPFDGFAGSAGSDQDNDGITDAQELAQGTNPGLADTDMDGLLDGSSISLTFGQSTHSSDLIAKWRALGIAHSVSADGKVFTFLGEKGKTDPVSRTSVVDGIPDGWLQKYNQVPPNIGHPALHAAYSCNRPAWWDEARLGVWWWGATPSAAFPCVSDMDRDGLDDRNGEDSIPAANRSATPKEHPRVAMSDPAIGRLALQAIAQTWGECAGNPSQCQNAWKGQGDPAGLQAPVELTVDALPATIGKMVQFEVSGKVCVLTGNSCQAVAKRTVTLQIDDPERQDRSLGVAFTDAQGKFTIQACLCTERSVTIPTDGMVAHSRDKGTVDWTIPTHGIPVGGQHSLVVRVYATSATLGSDDAAHPHFINRDVGGTTYHATSRATTEPAAVTVESTTQLTLETPDSLAWSNDRRLPVTTTLVDAAGGPLAGQDVRVTFSWSQQSLTEETNEQGKATWMISAPLDGKFQVQTHFDDTDDLKKSSSAVHDVELQKPMDLALVKLEPASGTIRTGDPVTMEVKATSRDQPAAGIPVRFILESTEVTMTTDAQGLAQATLSTQGITASTITMTAEVKATPQWAGATNATTITVVSGSLLEWIIPATAGHGEALAASGRLTLVDGTGLEGRHLTLFVAGEEVAAATTGKNGEFATDFTLPTTLAPGLWEVRLAYAGEGTIEGKESILPLRLVVPTSITFQDQQAGRGEVLELTGRLSRLTGENLRGEHVTIQLDGENITRALTNSLGYFAVPWTVPDDIALGHHEVRVVYSGSANGTYGATHKKVVLLVPTSTILILEDLGELGRGTHEIEGMLKTTTGEGIANATLNLSFGQDTIGQPRTREDGTFNQTLTLGSDATPGRFQVEAVHLGNETFARSEATASGTLVVQPDLAFYAPQVVGRGNDLTLRATLVDDVGKPVEGATITFNFLGVAVDATTASDGVASAALPVPADTPLQPSAAASTFAGSTGLKPAVGSQDILLKEGARLTVHGPSVPVRPLQPVDVRVYLTDLHGNPLPKQPVSIRFEGDTQAVVVQTDEQGSANATVTVPPLSSGSLLVRYGGDATYGPTETTSEVALVGIQTAKSSFVGTWTPAVLLLAGLATAGAGFVAWRRMRLRDPLLDALKAADKRIGAGASWSETVKQTYHELVEAANLHGHEEFASDSVRDFMRSLASVAPIPPTAAVALTKLFERATYSTGPGGPIEASTARQSLHDIIAAMEGYLKSGAST